VRSQPIRRERSQRIVGDLLCDVSTEVEGGHRVRDNEECGETEKALEEMHAVSLVEYSSCQVTKGPLSSLYASYFLNLASLVSRRRI